MQKEKRVSEDEMAGWHHRCNERELGQTLGDGEGQGGVVCCSPWGCKELDTTGQLTTINFYFLCKKSFYPCNAYKILKSIQKHEYNDSMDDLFIYKELLVLYYKATESGDTIPLCNSVLISSNHPILSLKVIQSSDTYISNISELYNFTSVLIQQPFFEHLLCIMTGIIKEKKKKDPVLDF